MSAQVPYVMHGAVVQGPAAVGVARVLARAESLGLLTDLDPGTRSVVTAIFQAAQAAIRLNGNADIGRSATQRTDDPAQSSHEVLSVREVMALFGVRERQARNICERIGWKSSGRWIVDARVARAELDRRGAA